MLGRKRRTAKIDSFIGHNTEIVGNIVFTGGLAVDGKVKGNIVATEEGALLQLGDQGTIEGEVRVTNVVLHGKIQGDVYAAERIELASNARVTGNVYYSLIEMAMGAEVNGQLVHRSEASRGGEGDGG